MLERAIKAIKSSLAKKPTLKHKATIYNLNNDSDKPATITPTRKRCTTAILTPSTTKGMRALTRLNPINNKDEPKEDDINKLFSF